jgi:hypothetical protein
MSPQLSVVARGQGRGLRGERDRARSNGCPDEWGGSPGVALMWQEWDAAIIARVFDRA